MMPSQSVMLTLLKAGAPSTEVLLAKSLEDLLAVGERFGIEVPLPELTMADEAHLKASPDIQGQPAADVIQYDVRRFTPPPSACMPTETEAAALARARSRSRRRAPGLALDSLQPDEGAIASHRATGRLAHRGHLKEVPSY